MFAVFHGFLQLHMSQGTETALRVQLRVVSCLRLSLGSPVTENDSFTQVKQPEQKFSTPKQFYDKLRTFNLREPLCLDVQNKLLLDL